MLRKITLFSILVILFTSTTWGFTVRNKNNRANKLFSKENYRKALDLYEELDKTVDVKKEEIKSILKYNKGNALSKLGKFEESMESYKKCLSMLEKVRKLPSIYYNMGNASYRTGKLKEALEYYKKTLDINPNDRDAKFNIELIKKKMEEQKKKEKDKKDQEKDKKDKGEKKEQQNKKSENEDKKKQKEQNKEKEQKEQKEQKPEKKKLSREDALRILKALEQKERELRKQKKARAGKRAGLSKDW
jgi:Ca-activated chloride channel family protein